MPNLLYTIPTKIIISTVIHTEPCFLMKIVIGTDGTNDPVVAAYNEADTSATAAKMILPSITYDASALGINGAIYHCSEYLDTGLYIAIANIGTGSVIVSTRTKSSLFRFKLS